MQWYVLCFFNFFHYNLFENMIMTLSPTQDHPFLLPSSLPVSIHLSLPSFLPFWYIIAESDPDNPRLPGFHLYTFSEVRNIMVLGFRRANRNVNLASNAKKSRAFLSYKRKGKDSWHALPGSPFTLSAHCVLLQCHLGFHSMLNCYLSTGAHQKTQGISGHLQ